MPTKRQGPGESGQSGRASSTSGPAAGTGRQPGAQPSALRDAVEDAIRELQQALGELQLQHQRQDFEARLALTREVQQAEFDQKAADGEAHWELMEALRAASGEENYAAVALQRNQEYERGLFERPLETQRRIGEADRAFQEQAEAAQNEYLQALRNIYLTHISRLQEAWASIDPETVDPGELAALGQLTTAAAQGLAATQTPTCVIAVG